MFDDRDIVCRMFAKLSDKLDTIEEKLDGIAERIEKIEDKLDERDLDAVPRSRPVPLPLPGDPYDISDAVSEAIRATGAESYLDMSRVIKAARGYLQRKGKQFKESELLSDVRQRDLFQHRLIQQGNEQI
jgi:hypothetical protein